MTKEKDWLIWCPRCGHKVLLRLNINPATGAVKVQQEWTSRMSFKQKDDSRKSLVIHSKNLEDKLCPRCNNKISFKLTEKNGKKTVEVSNGKFVGFNCIECKLCREVFELKLEVD